MAKRSVPSPANGGEDSPRHTLTPRETTDYSNQLHAPLGIESNVTESGVPYPPVKPTHLPADIVLDRLKTLKATNTGSGPWMATCPAHPESTPSLSIKETSEDTLLLNDFGGCPTDKVLAKLGLNLNALYASPFALRNTPRKPQCSARFRDNGHGSDAQALDDEQCEEWAMTLRVWKARSSHINQLAESLQLPVHALRALHVGYDSETATWIFPERDDRGRIAGRIRRFQDGKKRAVTGSSRGLTLPDFQGQPPAGMLFIAEGATDTAALVATDHFAIGRSSATASASQSEWLVRFLAQLPDRNIVVVGDRDLHGAGAEAAKSLSTNLRDATGLDEKWALPRKPFKDVREQFIAGKLPHGLSIQAS